MALTAEQIAALKPNEASEIRSWAWWTFDDKDANCAFFWQGRYHLHYIYRNDDGFAFAHVSSTDMVRWKWHPTTLTPLFAGHGMFSGTGFFTNNGQPAIIYHGEGSGRNHLAFALDDKLETWTKPVPINPLDAAGKEPLMRHWDPDCWLNGDTYYGLSGGENPPLMKSSDLKTWTYLGPLLHDDYPPHLGVPKGEDISCANMFRIGKGGTPIAIDRANRILQVGDVRAPFKLKAGERVELRVFIDKNLIEVFVNDRQAAVSARPLVPGNQGIQLFGESCHRRPHRRHRHRPQHRTGRQRGTRAGVLGGRQVQGQVGRDPDHRPRHRRLGTHQCRSHRPDRHHAERSAAPGPARKVIHDRQQISGDAN